MSRSSPSPPRTRTRWCSRRPAPSVIASSLFTPYAGLAWRDGTAISFQFHPEMSPAFARALYDSRRDRIPEVDAAIASLDAPNDNARSRRRGSGAS